jgi:hypothetical protein
MQGCNGEEIIFTNISTKNLSYQVHDVKGELHQQSLTNSEACQNSEGGARPHDQAYLCSDRTSRSSPLQESLSCRICHPWAYHHCQIGHGPHVEGADPCCWEYLLCFSHWTRSWRFGLERFELIHYSAVKLTHQCPTTTTTTKPLIPNKLG